MTARRSDRSAQGMASPVVHSVLRSPGQMLAPDTRAFFEARLGHDFGAVRVHADAEAAASARSVSATAYTVGHHIVFGAGAYHPGSEAGRQLLAHELTHVAQLDAAGRGSDTPSTLIASEPNDASERQAHAWTADGAAPNAGPAQPLVHPTATLLRQAEPEAEATSPPAVEPGVASASAGLYVDLFAEAFYDLDYRHEGGALSKWLTLNYLDGTIIDVHLDDIGNDEPSAEAGLRQMAKGSLGNGGRIFPEKMNLRTTPRLAAAKRSAIEAMEEYNYNFMLVTLPAVLFIITMPLMVRGTRPQALRRPVVRGPPKVPVAGAGAANAVEATVQAALKPNTLRHIFDKAAHKLAPLVKALGSEEAVVRQTAAALHKTVLPTAGQYEVQVLVAGTAVTVRGAVVNGIVRISTMFVP